MEGRTGYCIIITQGMTIHTVYIDDPVYLKHILSFKFLIASKIKMIKDVRPKTPTTCPKHVIDRSNRIESDRIRSNQTESDRV